MWFCGCFRWWINCIFWKNLRCSNLNRKNLKRNSIWNRNELRIRIIRGKQRKICNGFKCRQAGRVREIWLKHSLPQGKDFSNTQIISSTLLLFIFRYYNIIEFVDWSYKKYFLQNFNFLGWRISRIFINNNCSCIWKYNK